MGREEGGGFRMGNTCIPVVDVCVEGRLCPGTGGQDTLEN